MVANLMDSIRRALLPHKLHEEPRTSKKMRSREGGETNDTLGQTCSRKEPSLEGWKFGREDCAYFNRLMVQALATKGTDKNGVRQMFLDAQYVASFVPNYPDAPAVQALSWLYAGDYVKAAEYNRRALALDPENAIAKKVQEHIENPAVTDNLSDDAPASVVERQSHEGKGQG